VALIKVSILRLDINREGQVYLTEIWDKDYDWKDVFMNQAQNLLGF